MVGLRHKFSAPASTWFDTSVPDVFEPETVALLAELSTSGTDPRAWTELWNELYHQYDSDVACAALPELAAIAVAGRQRVIARQLTFLFGHATCTEGGHEFIPAAAVEKAVRSGSILEF